MHLTASSCVPTSLSYYFFLWLRVARPIVVVVVVVVTVSGVWYLGCGMCAFSFYWRLVICALVHLSRERTQRTKQHILARPALLARWIQLGGIFYCHSFFRTRCTWNVDDVNMRGHTHTHTWRVYRYIHLWPLLDAENPRILLVHDSCGPRRVHGSSAQRVFLRASNYTNKERRSDVEWLHTHHHNMIVFNKPTGQETIGLYFSTKTVMNV